jgi:hypothetical protein
MQASSYGGAEGAFARLAWPARDEQGHSIDPSRRYGPIRHQSHEAASLKRVVRNEFRQGSKAHAGSRSDRPHKLE